MGLDINTAHENGRNECHQSSTVKKKKFGYQMIYYVAPFSMSFCVCLISWKQRNLEIQVGFRLHPQCLCIEMDSGCLKGVGCLITMITGRLIWMTI